MQAQLLLESAQAMKSKAARDGAFATMAACALRYGQLEAVAGASVAALTRNEHLAGVLAELAEFCEAKYHDERLVCSDYLCTGVADAISNEACVWASATHSLQFFGHLHQPPTSLTDVLLCPATCDAHKDTHDQQTGM